MWGNDNLLHDRIFKGINYSNMNWYFKKSLQTFLLEHGKIKGTKPIKIDESIDNIVELVEERYNKAKEFVKKFDNVDITLSHNFSALVEKTLASGLRYSINPEIYEDGEHYATFQSYDSNVFFLEIRIKNPNINYFIAETPRATIPMKGTIAIKVPIMLFQVAQFIKGKDLGTASFLRLEAYWFPENGHRYWFPFLNVEPHRFAASNPCLGSYSGAIYACINKLDFVSLIYNLMDWSQTFLAGETGPYSPITKCFLGYPGEYPKEMWNIEGMSDARCYENFLQNVSFPDYCKEINCAFIDTCNIYKNKKTPMAKHSKQGEEKPWIYHGVLDPIKGILGEEYIPIKEDVMKFTENWLHDHIESTSTS